MAKYVHRILSEGAAISDTMPVLTSERRLVAVTVHCNTAASTAENLSFTLDSGAGSEYDCVLYAVDLGTGTLSNAFKSDFNLPLLPGDSIKTTYTNTDALTMGIQLLLE